MYKVDISTPCKICVSVSDNREDQGLNCCTITWFHIYSSFFEKAAKPTFLTRIDIHRHYGKTIRSAYLCFSFRYQLEHRY